MRHRLASPLVMSLALIALLPTVPRESLAKTARPVTGATAYFTDNNVSIVTEAPSATAGLDDESIADLASEYAAAGLPRILPVVGLGPIANARDLLHMRGIDMAVLDADIAAYARIDGGLPGVEQRLSAMIKLYDKTVYVIAGPGVHAIGDLTGQRVLAPGQDSDSHVSARTLFSLLGIRIELGDADLDAATQAIAQGTAKALVLTANAGAGMLSHLPTNTGLHLIAVPWTDAIAKVYSQAAVGPDQAAGLVPPEGVATVSVACLLATYNWRPQLVRYQPVMQFLRDLPKAVAQLRTGGKASVWRTVDGRGAIPGWLRFDATEQLLAGIEPDLRLPSGTSTSAASTRIVTVLASASPSSASGVAATQPADVPAAAAPVAPAFTEPVELAAYPLAGLTDRGAPAGGVVAELVAAGLPGVSTTLTWSPDAQGGAKRVSQATGARLGLPWARPDCEHRTGLAAPDAKLCDDFLFSRPVFRTLKVFFVRHGSDFTFERDDQVAGRTVCAAADDDVSTLDSPERLWLKQEMLTLLRRPTLGQCLAALDRGEIEAVFSDDFVGQAELAQLGIGDHIEVVNRPVATRDFSAVASKSDPRGAELIHRLNDGLALLKATGRFADIVLKRLRRDQASSGESVLQ